MDGARLKPMLPGIIGMLVFVLAAVHGYRILGQVVDNTNARKETRQTLMHAKDVLSLLKDVESGQRGFIITGDPAYLEPYEDARRQLGIRHAELESILARLGVAEPALRTLHEHIRQRLAITAEILDIRTRLGPEAARQAILSGRGKAAMDSLRGDFARIEAHLNLRIHTLDQRVDTLQQEARRVAILLVSLGGLLLLATYVLWQREYGRRVRAEQALTAKADDLARLRGAELESIFEALPDLFFRLGPDGTILDYRAHHDDLYLPPAHFLGQPMQKILPPEVGTLFDEHLARLRDGSSLVAFEYPLSVAGRTRHFEARMSRLAGMEEVVLVVRDVTDRVEADRALVQAQEDLRAFARKLDLDIEAERKRLAREVHDQLGQIFTALKMKLLDCQPGRPMDPAMVTALDGLLDEGIRVTRRISADLRPAMLDDLGLGPALEHYARVFGERSSLVVEVAVAPDARLTPAQTNQLFRIAQEALTNVARHADARRVRIRGGVEEGVYVLTIEDDGKGLMDNNMKGLGMLGMQERAELMGAGLSVDGSELGGTRIRVRLPLMGEET